MSRPIKFRAWHKSRKAFMYFELSELNDSMITKVDNGWYLEDCDLMQFTGLLDKNDKEVFEGDIVDSNYAGKPKRRVVKWASMDNEYGVRGYGFILYDDASEVKVIGNIYEYPNLLTDQE